MDSRRVRFRPVFTNLWRQNSVVGVSDNHSKKSYANCSRERSRPYPGSVLLPFSRARLPAGSTGSHCSRVSREATAMGSRSATSRASPLQYGPNHAVSCSTRHEAGHQDGHLQARTHAVGALKRLKRNLSSTRKTTANLSAASEGVTQPLISRREPKGLLPGQLMQTI